MIRDEEKLRKETPTPGKVYIAPTESGTQQIRSKGWARQARFRLFILAVLLFSGILGVVIVPRFYSSEQGQGGVISLYPQPTPQSGSTTSSAKTGENTGSFTLPPHAGSNQGNKPSSKGTNGTTSTTSQGGNQLDPSNQAMPTGDLPGWHQIFAENFNTPASLGSFPGSVYGNEFTVYPDGTRDTAGQQQNAPSRYEPSKVLSVSNGLLNIYLHTENGTPMSAAVLPNVPGNHLYGKYTVRFRADALQGFKTAWLLWPDSENWPHDGEIDFPENNLDDTIHAFVHHVGATSGSDQDAFNTTATDTSWHTASIEWTSGLVRFILDGQVIGSSTDRIPSTPMHWVLQSEACLNGCPPAAEAGYIQVAWITAYSPA